MVKFVKKLKNQMLQRHTALIGLKLSESKVATCYLMMPTIIKTGSPKIKPKELKLRIIKMSLDQFTKIYLDYFNNFATVKAFADHYGITEDEARKIITLGNNVYNLNIDFGHTNQ